MRTTISFDRDIEQQIRSIVKKSGKSLKQIVNDLLRAGLSSKRISKQNYPAFKVQAKHLGIASGIDPENFNSLLDELDAEHFRARLLKGGK